MRCSIVYLTSDFTGKVTDFSQAFCDGIVSNCCVGFGRLELVDLYTKLFRDTISQMTAIKPEGNALTGSPNLNILVEMVVVAHVCY